MRVVSLFPYGVCGLFPTGRVLSTPRALGALGRAGQSAAEFLERHPNGDWGEITAIDVDENNFSLKNGYRILSAYNTKTGERIWIITEADRSMTTILLPEEYH